MNFLKKEITDALSAFTHWIMPPAVRRYRPTTPGSRLFRYPSVGSEPIENEDKKMNYQTAYRDSLHHIRNFRDIHKPLARWAFEHDPLGESVEEKLQRFGYLTQGQFKDTDAVQKAKEQFEKDHGVSADVRVYHDDLGFFDENLNKNNREAVGEWIASYFEGVKNDNAAEGYYNDLHDIYNANFTVYKTFDMADDPVYRQMILDFEYRLREIADDRVDVGKLPVFKSNPAYWAILDDNFSGENRKKIQSSVKNWIGDEDLTPVVYGEGEIPAPKKVPTVNVPHVSPYVE